MEPNNSNLEKLEQDLQNLSQEVKTGETNTSPVDQSTPEVPSVSMPQPVINTPVGEPEKPAESNTSEGDKKNSSPVTAVAILLGVIALLAIAAYVVGAMFFSPKSTSPKACTAEAKICPDGSSVGRTGPNCEFAACPSAVPSPLESPVSTGSATPVSTMTASPSASPMNTPTSSASASPSSTP